MALLVGQFKKDFKSDLFVRENHLWITVQLTKRVVICSKFLYRPKTQRIQCNLLVLPMHHWHVFSGTLRNLLRIHKLTDHHIADCDISNSRSDSHLLACMKISIWDRTDASDWHYTYFAESTQCGLVIALFMVCMFYPIAHLTQLYFASMVQLPTSTVM